MNLHQFREPRTTPYQTRFINRLAEVADNAIVQCAVAASNAAMHIRSPQGVRFGRRERILRAFRHVG
jgi:hypothetical protein